MTKMIIECPECGYGWGEEAYEAYQKIKAAMKLENVNFHCVGMGLRVDSSKRQSHVEQTREVVEKRVR